MVTKPRNKKNAVIYDSRDCKQLFFASTCENLT